MAEQKQKTGISKLNFEQAIKELTDIVGKIEQGQIPLQDSLQQYERGMALIKHCKDILKGYKMLYAELNVDKGFELSPGFAESVMSRLPQEKASKSLFNYKVILMAGISFLVIFTTAIYLFNWKWFIQTVSGISSPFFKTTLTSARLIEGFFANLNIDVSLLLIAALVLIIFGLLDQLFFSKKHKLISFFQVTGTT